MTLTALVQTIFIGLASADFWLYHTIKHVPNWQAMDSYQIWDDNPACDQVWTQVDYDYSPDVSGDKTGIRCVSYEGFEGCGFDADAKDIDVIEMNFHGVEPIYHWSEFTFIYPGSHLLYYLVSVQNCDLDFVLISPLL